MVSCRVPNSTANTDSANNAKNANRNTKARNAKNRPSIIGGRIWLK